MSEGTRGVSPRTRREFRSEAARNRGTGPRGRHGLRAKNGDQFAHSLSILGLMAREGVRVSARLTDLETGRPLLRVDDYVVAQTGSLGKVLLLIEAADRCAGGPGPMLTREPGDAAAGAGIWQDLSIDTLPMADIAALIGATNDHLATNVLLRSVGLEAMTRRAESLSLRHTRLRDGVSGAARTSARAALSRSTMTELSELLWRLDRGEILSPEISQRVTGWLSRSSDVGQIGVGFGVDPLAHADREHGLVSYALVTRERGLRAEAGVLRGDRGGVCYAVKAAFGEEDPASGYAVQEGLRAIGVELLDHVVSSE